MSETRMEAVMRENAAELERKQKGKEPVVERMCSAPDRPVCPANLP